MRTWRTELNMRRYYKMSLRVSQSRTGIERETRRTGLDMRRYYKMTLRSSHPKRDALVHGSPPPAET